MEIIETSIFTKKVIQYLNDEEYRKLQKEIVAFPEKGRLIKGSGGLRKIRCGTSSKGKRGGFRIIYYWLVKSDIILMLLIYPKNELDDLTDKQLKVLKSLVEEELK